MAAGFKILTFADREEWREYLSRIRAEDIFFTPEYLKCNEIIMAGEAECFIYHDADTVILYPYILRKIEGTNYKDTTSGYGYGGFIGWPRNEKLREFREAFRKYCVENNIVSEFIRFNPFYNNLYLNQDENGDIVGYQKLVYCKTGAGLANVKANMAKKVWEKIRKAIREGVEVIESKTDPDYSSFVDLYYDTMFRLQASDFYFFPRSFFFKLRELLSEDIRLFLSRRENKVLAGLLVVAGREYSYNFLSASAAVYKSLGLKDFLQYEALNWACAAGKQAHLLGGGLKEEDSLFRFKAKFSPWRETYYLGKVVHLADTYLALCQAAGVQVPEATAVSLTDAAWFPAYRFPAGGNGQK